MATYTTTYLTTTRGTPPPGYRVDFDHPARKGDVTGYWVFAIGLVVAFMFLLMRLYTKICVSRSFVIDDACIVLSFVRRRPLFVLTNFSLTHSLDMWQNEIQGLIMCASVLYAPAQGFAKFSLLLFYRRLAPFKWFQVAIYIVMFVVFAYTLGIMFSLIFPCRPIVSNWDVTVTGKCISKTGIYIATAVINIATDIALLVLPIPVLARLQMPLLEKAALIAMFSIGSMTCITSIVRLVLLLPMLTDLDQTWAVSIPCVWILVEANLVVICGCLPIVRKFARHVAPKLFSESSSGRKSGGYAGRGKRSFDFQTIGSKRSRPLGSRNKKGKMDYSNIELNSTWAGGDDTVAEAEAEGAERGGSSQGGRRTAWSDGGSETCIVETKTTVVEYGDSTESIRNGFARPRGI
ncbi:hypothetical protein B0J12DRAFT_718522 [Macrophomina phaseolina]|uniref:Rhodopsin domain-containing protein n=1 Tax=Macrophomina phaseolina TaxID=35725 RepID=A0ABQ8GEL0_9PEZI|nr:hypothetical protein B0J12DRAFT_718522 [Macrophomina phaseolina]